LRGSDTPATKFRVAATKAPQNYQICSGQAIHHCSLRESGRWLTFVLDTAFMFTIPNLFTSCNLLFGCCALVSLQKGNAEWCIYFLVLAAFADLLDGFVARKMNKNSALGVQLDSLSDVVSFGLVPGMIAFGILESAHPAMSWIPFFAFSLTIMAAFRLARFNVHAGESLPYFTGLPVPACGLFFAGMLGMQGKFPAAESVLFHPFFFLGCVLLMSVLMVSRLKIIKYHFRKSWMRQYGYIPLIGAGSLVFAPWIGAGALSLGVLLHVILSLLLPDHHFKRQHT
jgi:CDP-diacylglycerol--serine O-phosphatidyltransferase